MRSGESGFKTHFGDEFFAWHSRPENKQKSDLFRDSMKAFSVGELGNLLVDLSVEPRGVFCDVGGGVGHLAAAVLEHYPDSSAVIVDQPTVIPGARDNIREKGLSNRTKFVEADFFKPMPKSALEGCDMIAMKHILHDWSDEQSVTILRNLRAAVKPGARLVVIEMVSGEKGPSMQAAVDLMDVNMLANNPPGAKERSTAEYSALFRAAGMEGKVTARPLRTIYTAVEVPF